MWASRGGGAALTLTTARGTAAKLATRGVDRAAALAGIGEQAWAGPDWVAARSGDAVVRLAAPAAPPDVLTGLLGTPVSWLPTS